MHDEHIEDRLFDYFSGRLSEEDKAALLRWIEEDESHKQIFSEMSDWWATAHVPLFASEMRENFATRLSPLLKKQKRICPQFVWQRLVLRQLLLCCC